MKTAMHSRHRGSWLATCVLLAGGSGERWSDLDGPSSAWKPDSGLYHTIKDLQSDKFTCGLVLVEEPVLLIWLLYVMVVHPFFSDLICRIFGFCVCVQKEAARLCEENAVKQVKKQASFFPFPMGAVRERIPTWSKLHIPTLHLCHHLFVEAVPQEHMLNEIYTPSAQQCWHSDEIDVPAFLLLIIFLGLNVVLTAWPMESGNGRVSFLLWLPIDSHNYKRSESIGTNESDLSPASDSLIILISTSDLESIHCSPPSDI